MKIQTSIPTVTSKTAGLHRYHYAEAWAATEGGYKQLMPGGTAPADFEARCQRYADRSGRLVIAARLAGNVEYRPHRPHRPATEKQLAFIRSCEGKNMPTTMTIAEASRRVKYWSAQLKRHARDRRISRGNRIRSRYS